MVSPHRNPDGRFPFIPARANRGNASVTAYFMSLSKERMNTFMPQFECDERTFPTRATRFKAFPEHMNRGQLVFVQQVANAVHVLRNLKEGP
jgi:hypothetical protein